MGGISKRQRALRKNGRKAGALHHLRKLERQLGEKYHPEIHDPVKGVNNLSFVF